MVEITAYTSRTIDYEPDTAALIPQFPDYVIVGTYSLSSEDAQVDTSDSTDQQQSSVQRRHGMLQVLPFDYSPTNLDGDSLARSLVAYKFPDCGIYSVHFHPQYSHILGAAASDARIYFFHVSASASSESNHPVFSLTLIGSVLVENPEDNDGQIAIITQFHFLTSPSNPETRITLVATSQFGNTKHVLVDLPNISEHTWTSDGAIATSLACQTQQVHQQAYGMEAWSVLALSTTSTTPTTLTQHTILSGGDDSQLILSASTTPAQQPPTFHSLLIDRHAHTAGIVSITSLGPVPFQLKPATTKTSLPPHLIATGSYDEHLRIFLFDPSPFPSAPRPTLTLLSTLKLPSGVWRITLLDHYTRSNTHPRRKTDYLLLIAGHTAGAFIVRLTITSSEADADANKRHHGEIDGEQYTSPPQITAELHEEASFTIGHGSLVYSCLARLGAPAAAAAATTTPAGGVEHQSESEVKLESGRVWHVLSCSFYDKRLCNWQWTDREWVASI